MYRWAGLGGIWPYDEVAESVSWFNIAAIFKSDCGRFVVSGEL
jgi:hypothetical protein